MEYNEEDFLQLSGIQHFVFCRRQWALTHIEQMWADNVRTIEGEIIHERAHDSTFTEKRGSIIISRAMPVCSKTLGLSGECDIVELHEDKNGVSIFGRDGTYSPVPVEYKRGAPKDDECDIMQLCAQAMCLEDMLLCSVPVGFLFYAQTKRRERVELTEALRQKTTDICEQMHDYYRRGYTPKCKTSVKCNACSLKDICLPKLCNIETVSEYINRLIGGDEL